MNAHGGAGRGATSTVSSLVIWALNHGGPFLCITLEHIAAVPPRGAGGWGFEATKLGRKRRRANVVPGASYVRSHIIPLRRRAPFLTHRPTLLGS